MIIPHQSLTHGHCPSPVKQPTPEEEIRRIAAEFEGYHSEPFERAGFQGSRWGLAHVCRVRPGRVLHVIGASEMAETLRQLLAEGAVVGWTLQPSPN
jgi:hypothetical protein